MNTRMTNDIASALFLAHCAALVTGILTLVRALTALFTPFVFVFGAEFA